MPPVATSRSQWGHAQTGRRGGTAVVLATVAAACSSGGADPTAGTSITGPSSRPPATSAAPATPPPSSTAATGHLSSAWPTYHRDNSRQGQIAGAPDPEQPRVAWRTALDGPAYASPLVVGSYVIEATTGGSVYALDAGSGAIRWRTHLADPVAGSTLPCGNIDRLGVVGTPAYDQATGLVFAVNTQAGPHHILYGLDARTGAIRIHRNVDPAGIDPATHLQRAALAVANSRVYVAYGGNYGDCGQYQGRVVAVPTSGNGPMLSFAVPTRREAGIWGPSGPAVTSTGQVVVTTGNGEATGGTWDKSDSVLRLSPTLQLQDGFRPPAGRRRTASMRIWGRRDHSCLPVGGRWPRGRAARSTWSMSSTWAALVVNSRLCKVALRTAGWHRVRAALRARRCSSRAWAASSRSWSARALCGAAGGHRFASPALPWPPAPRCGQSSRPAPWTR